MLIKLKRGLDLSLAGAPGSNIETAPEPRQVGLVGLDYLDLKPSLAVKVGDHVRAGQTLFTHRTHQALRFTAPGTGRVAAINRGPKRSLESVVIELANDDGAEGLACPEVRGCRDPDRIRQALTASGLWSAFRVRPYSRVPSPEGAPKTLFITAMDTHPLAPDPAPVIAEREEDFEAGLACLSLLCGGTVYLCTAPEAKFPMPQAGNLKPVRFAGRHPAGLPGTHIHFLEPCLTTDADTWYVGYQDVLSIGRLYRTGVPSLQRVVSVAGPACRRPRLLRTRLGVDLADLLDGEFTPGVRVISGSLLAGRRANPSTRYLGRYHNQVSLLREGISTASEVSRLQGLRRYLGELMRDLVTPGRGPTDALPDTRMNGSPAGMIPAEVFETVWPLRTPPAPLLRALLIGDTETAMALGCLALDEEDLAQCAYVCPSKQNYGAALRDTLRAIEQAQQ